MKLPHMFGKLVITNKKTITQVTRDIPGLDNVTSVLHLSVELFVLLKKWMEHNLRAEDSGLQLVTIVGGHLQVLTTDPGPVLILWAPADLITIWK